MKIRRLHIADYTAAEMLACAERETKLRKRVYPNRVETGRMSKEQAAHEIACMQAIADYFRQLAAKERLL